MSKEETVMTHKASSKVVALLKKASDDAQAAIDAIEQAYPDCNEYTLPEPMRRNILSLKRISSTAANMAFDIEVGG
jgi:hypothetical protein